MTKKILIIAATFLASSLSAFLAINYFNQRKLISPVANQNITPAPKSLDKYSFPVLRRKKIVAGTIIFDKILNETSDFISYLFFYDSEEKKVSGLANLPKKAGKYPVIVQFRGYIDRDNYTTGMGTVHSGEVFAQNGFITLAPDFLGYGQSASPSALPIEERFETYTTALNLLSSVINLNQTFTNANITNISADIDKIGIWGHSNGGHIALSVLEITGGNYPTVLWNPVSKSFPYSILYYSDEAEDNGKALRKLVADFEKDYDAEKYSPANYLDWINAPIELHQAQDDEAVPLKWSDQLVQSLKRLDKEVTYFTYPGDNHDFNKGSWNTVVARNISFYQSHFARAER